jgi:fatty-acyl-CoA synthase
MPVSPDLVRRLESRLGISLQISYGQTEVCGCSHGVRGSDPPAVKAETVGRPLPRVEVRISDPAGGGTQPVETVGEVLVRGYQVMKGYFELPEATADAIDSDGWLHTGDIGSMDREGNLRIAGRLKEMIIRGGENIYPREVEAVIESHSGVAVAAVLGVPDPLYGEHVAAFVELVPGATVSEAELRASCEQQLADFKVPTRWAFIDVMPRTPLGKIQKFELRRALVEGSMSAPAKLR